MRLSGSLILHLPVDSVLTQRAFPQKWRTLGLPLTSLWAGNILVKIEASFIEWHLFNHHWNPNFFNHIYEVAFCFLGQTRCQSKSLETISECILPNEILQRFPIHNGRFAFAVKRTSTYIPIRGTKNSSRKKYLGKSTAFGAYPNIGITKVILLQFVRGHHSSHWHHPGHLVTVTLRQFACLMTRRSLIA